jgi:hypothetical protein
MHACGKSVPVGGPKTQPRREMLVLRRLDSHLEHALCLPTGLDFRGSRACSPRGSPGRRRRAWRRPSAWAPAGRGCRPNAEPHRRVGTQRGACRQRPGRRASREGATAARRAAPRAASAGVAPAVASAAAAPVARRRRRRHWRRQRLRHARLRGGARALSSKQTLALTRCCALRCGPVHHPTGRQQANPLLSTARDLPRDAATQRHRNNWGGEGPQVT